MRTSKGTVFYRKMESNKKPIHYSLKIENGELRTQIVINDLEILLLLEYAS